MISHIHTHTTGNLITFFHRVPLSGRFPHVSHHYCLVLAYNHIPFHSGDTLADSPGMAVLFTCDYETTEELELEPLLGTKEDAKQMRMTFDYLNYIVHEIHNPTGAEMRAKLQEVSDYLAKYDGEVKDKVIIFAFSGHGYSEGKIEKIFANDGDELEVVAEIVQHYFTAHKCVGGIPKLFFIDACRGSDWIFTDSDEEQEEGAKSQEEPLAKGAAHTVANYRIEYATIPHHKSYMDSVDKGSMWMPKLAKALRHNKDEAVSVISDRVKKEVFGEKSNQVAQTVGQIITGPVFLQKQ